MIGTVSDSLAFAPKDMKKWKEKKTNAEYWTWKQKHPRWVVQHGVRNVRFFFIHAIDYSLYPSWHFVLFIESIGFALVSLILLMLLLLLSVVSVFALYEVHVVAPVYANWCFLPLAGFNSVTVSISLDVDYIYSQFSERRIANNSPNILTMIFRE